MKRNKEYKHMSDADLVGGYLAGDDHAFEELFGRYRPELLIFIFHKLGDWEKAEDMLQDVFTDVIKELKSHAYHENGKFRGWLFEHARNTVADEIRKLMRHPRKKDAEPEMLPDNNPTIEENIISRQEYSRLKTARKHLSSRHQREIQLRYDEGKSHREISEIMHISEARSRTLCRDAINSLRKWMGKNGEG
jgi:RNA polymerase sigma-70 factor (ECF subfamily)